MARPRYSHSGICVTDLERSRAFYKNVLGFEDGISLAIDSRYHALLGMEGAFSLRSEFFHLGGLVIELLHWPDPRPLPADGIHPLNRVGLTHLSFHVDDLDAAIAQVEAFGGTVLHKTRSRFELPTMAGEIIFVTDPDGTRIELNDYPVDIDVSGRTA